MRAPVPVTGGPPRTDDAVSAALRGYPAEVEQWCRTQTVEHAGRRLQMTITPGEKVVQLWDLDGEDRPVAWLGNVIGVQGQPFARVRYGVRLTYTEEQSLAALAAAFWND